MEAFGTTFLRSKAVSRLKLATALLDAKRSDMSQDHFIAPTASPSHTLPSWSPRHVLAGQTFSRFPSKYLYERTMGTRCAQLHLITPIHTTKHSHMASMFDTLDALP